MKQGEIYDEQEEMTAEARRDGWCEAVDEFYFCLKNQITIDAFTRAKDQQEVLAILKRQYDQFKSQYCW